ncbi:metal-sensitive transcriptional regulator [Desulfitobacterium sp. AusDCA]|uniref:metal-sensitive transcriptional regulator n=1 Tax=Desulfitobacterium sp. AusDCA TaxID=3240383 RepID=UPI003DA76968
MENNIMQEDLQIMRRLQTIKGHVNAVEQMIAEEKSYEDIIFQLEAIRAAVAKTTSVAAQYYAQTCISEALQDGDKNIDALNKAIEILVRVSQFTTESIN